MTTSIELLRLLVINYEPDVLLIQETFLTKNKKTPVIEDYNSYRKDRTLPTQVGKPIRGGGLLTYVHNKYKFKEIAITQSDCDSLEISAVEIQCDEPLIVYNIYRPPLQYKDTRCPNLSLDCIDLKNNMKNDVVIMGDFNTHNHMWEENSIDDINGEIVSEWISENNLVCWNEPSIPTRLESRTSPDITLTNTNMRIKSWSTLGTVNSDHSPMMIVIQNSCKNVDYQKVKKCGFNWAEADWTNFSDDLELVSERIQNIKINEKKAKIFKNEILKAKSKHVPRIYVRRRKAKKWWNSELMKQLRQFEAKQKEITDDSDLNDENMALLKKLNEEICEKVKECREQQIEKRVKECVTDDGSPNKDGILKYMDDVRKLDGRCERVEIPFIHDPNMEKIIDDKEKADFFTDFFSTIVGKDINEKYRHNFNMNIKDDIVPFTFSEVMTQLGKLHSTKSSPDGMNAILLQNLKPKMQKTLVDILNNSWLNMVVPNDWKQTYWVPIAKPGKDPHNPASYRMIALTPAIAKLIEKLIKNRLVYHLEKHNNGVKNLSHNQAAYRKTRSCREQILYLIDILKENRIRGKTSAVVFMDIKKAFDSVNHHKLQERMRKMSIPENYIRWVESFLHKRTAATIINSRVSKYIKLTNGVPQGTVLASILFVLYIDEITEIIENKANMSLYADDIAFVVSDENCAGRLSKRVQTVFTKAEEHLNNINLELARDKTKIMIVDSSTSRKKKCQYKIKFKDKTCLTETDSERFLGVQIDNDLSFSDHVSQICKSVNKKLRFLKMLADKRWGCTKNIIRLVYLIYIIPVFTYAIESLYSTIVRNRKLMRKLNTLHMKAAQIITGADYGTKFEKVLEESCVADLNSYYLVETARWAAKIERLRASPCTKRLMEKRKIKYKHMQTLCFAIKTYSDIGLTDLPVELYPPTYFPPWKDFDKIEINENIGARKCENTNRNQDICKELIRKLEEKYENNILATIYTDGSVSEGVGGASFVINFEEKFLEGKFPAGKICSSFRSELFAIYHALNTLLKVIKKKPNRELEDKAILVLSDSQSALSELKRGHCYQRTELGLKCWIILGILCEQGLKVNISHIFSHCGIEGNERADALAAEAVHMEQDKVKVDYKTVTTKMKFLHTKVKIGKKESFPPKFNREMEILISQIRMGKACFTTKQTDNRYRNGLCQCCEVEDTVQHFVCECPAFYKERKTNFESLILSEQELEGHVNEFDGMKILLKYICEVGKGLIQRVRLIRE